tara:strand:+ start:296 stop:976 length:681 start_codon:yes stop_codon:yes gene_type:complete
MDKKFKSITIKSKNKRHLKKFKNLIVVEKTVKENNDLKSEDDIFKIANKQINETQKIKKTQKVSKNPIPKKTKKRNNNLFIDLKHFEHPVKPTYVSMSPVPRYYDKQNDKNKKKSINPQQKPKKIKEIKKPLTVKTQETKKKKKEVTKEKIYKLPTPTTKNEYQIKPKIKTINSINILDYNKTNINTIKHKLKQNNITVNNNTPDKLCKDLLMCLNINTNHKIKLS